MTLLALMSLLSCGESIPAPDSPGPAADAQRFEPLSDLRFLRRLSLDLRGTLPSVDEYLQVESDPAAILSLRAAWMEDPLFEERLVVLLGERWHTLVDEYDGFYYDFQLSGDQRYNFQRSIGQEPLRLLAHVVTSDLPWTDVVTADYTMVNPLLADIWPVEGYPEGAEGWFPATYTDGRPAAGVLATNGLWWRYSSTTFNQNRARAAVIARLLVCEDLLARPVTFAGSEELLLAEDTSSMVRSVPACLACHSTVEPLAATLFGFALIQPASAYEKTLYHPEREIIGPLELKVEPAFFGTPVNGLEELGRVIAADERFAACAVETFTEGLLARETTLDDFLEAERLQEDFVAGDLRVKPLLAAVTDMPEYRAGGITDAVTDTDADQAMTVRMVSAQMLRSIYLDLTDFDWLRYGTALLDDDVYGVRVLGGGVDGEFMLTPQQDPGMTWALVAERTAQLMAQVIVTNELVVGEGHGGLLSGASLALPSTDPAWGQAVGLLHLRLFGERPDVERLAAYAELFEHLQVGADAETAWTGLLVAMLRDPEFLAY
jgi:hypothetical protein